jgi:uncharacterized PurR-regulated membrane protein YhhQ (DUF165 family)
MILIAAVGMVLESLFLAVPWRIILASFIAIVLSETADTEVYHKLLQRSWFQRVLGSNLVSIPLDSILFNVIAFAGVFEPGMMVAIIFGEIVVKLPPGRLRHCGAPRSAASTRPPLDSWGSHRRSH